MYGGVGIGKTHLIQAVGNAILAKDPSAHVVYISSEQFVQELNKLVDYEFEVKYNSITEQAFDQYRRSCIKLTDHADPQIRAWRTAILELFTDKAQSLPQRLQIAEEIFYNTYYEI